MTAIDGFVLVLRAHSVSWSRSRSPPPDTESFVRLVFPFLRPDKALNGTANKARLKIRFIDTHSLHIDRDQHCFAPCSGSKSLWLLDECLCWPNNCNARVTTRDFNVALAKEIGVLPCLSWTSRRRSRRGTSSGIVGILTRPAGRLFANYSPGFGPNGMLIANFSRIFFGALFPRFLIDGRLTGGRF